MIFCTHGLPAESDYLMIAAAILLQRRDLSTVRVPLGGVYVYTDECVYCFDYLAIIANTTWFDAGDGARV